MAHITSVNNVKSPPMTRNRARYPTMWLFSTLVARMRYPTNAVKDATITWYPLSRERSECQANETTIHQPKA